jgi:hypothetical protein
LWLETGLWYGCDPLMNEMEHAIHQALVELDQAVRQSQSGGAKPDLIARFARIDELTRQLPRGTDPDLLHYLHRKSYEKARLWLEGRNAGNVRGPCAGEE